MIHYLLRKMSISMYLGELYEYKIYFNSKIINIWSIYVIKKVSLVYLHYKFIYTHLSLVSMYLGTLISY